MIYYIVTNTHFNDRDKDRFGVNFFLNKGISVKVIDVQDYTNPELHNDNKPEYDNENNLDVIQCSNFNDFKNAFNLDKEGIAILFLSDNLQSIKIRNFFKNKKIKIGILNAGMLPMIPNKLGILSKVMNKIVQLKPTNFMKLVMLKGYSKIFDYKNYDFLITSNYETSVKNYGVTSKSSVIETHCLDYDLTLKYENDLSIVEKKYVVFLDQYLLNHTDFIRSKIKLQISEDNYYLQLNTLFDKIENQFGYMIVIAAHPRANIDKYNVLFNKKKIFFGHTALLVKHCEFTITHYSTAINFAVIYQKPILFLNSDELVKNNLSKYITLFASVLSQPLLNMSTEYDLPQKMDTDKDKYLDYKMRYIKKNHLESSSWDIFYTQYIQKELNART